MSNVSQWSTTASSNNSAAPNGAPEGMSPGGVNDVSRENMAATAKWYGDSKGSLVSAGTGTAYTLTSNSSHAALGDIGQITFRAHLANTGSATLAVDSLTAKTLKLAGSNLGPGVLPLNSLVTVVYNSNQDVFDVVAGADPAPSDTFIPTVEFGGGTTGQVYGVRRGNYRLNGDWCDIVIWLNFSNKGTSTGNATISGLPFTNAASDDFTYGSAVGLANMASAQNSPMAYVDGSGTELILREDSGFLTHAEFANTSIVTLNLSYRVVL